MSGSEINNVQQMSELDQIDNNSISHRETRDEAIKRFKLAKELLDSHRPKNINELVPKISSSGKELNFWASTLIVGMSGMFLYPVTQSLLCMLSMPVGIAVAILFLRAENSANNHLNSKFDKLLCKIFFNKKRKASLRERQEIFKSHKKSEELYAMLLQTTMAEFSQYKTFEIINDLSNPEHREFVCMNPLLKEPYLTDRETYVGAVKHAMLSNPDELNKVLTKTLTEKIALLSLEPNTHN